ncbi:2-dehydro-3-deoxygalactonokinase [Adhaeribacter pallidiroseus]|uniref:2-dehydro-3-deoxygalactonokinase n=1 Tax=Adhaeribacter pallidiroseus TaxID=2072847 RepID=A0A369QPA3_9BACT|nr:2-dehydro-3-deoxygalactonokinase [Adhaeribacter pallidiroseus]RDC65505.1 2-dehydro-3-deoxygalactonokinase [Adhaeribacter pallidiroseus]
MSHTLLCCDWGTSSFRLRLVNKDTRQILGEVINPEGIASTFNAWKNQAKTNGVSRKQFFQEQLRHHIQNLAAKLHTNLDATPLVLSGMASSSLGLEELPYAELPFAVDGSQAGIRHFERQPDFPHDLLLISGIRTDGDVMRGEETQLVGLIHLMDLAGITGESIFIFPGTHSKHITVRQQQVISFQTFMTGEIFNLMAGASILKDSIESPDSAEIKEPELNGFRSGVRESGNSTILHGLFTVRTNQLFRNLTKKQNFYYLSGLLIGTELRSLLPKEAAPIILSSGSNLFKFYKLALEELQLLNDTIIIPPEFIDKATIAGQVTIFQQQQVPLIKPTK